MLNLISTSLWAVPHVSDFMFCTLDILMKTSWSSKFLSTFLRQLMCCSWLLLFNTIDRFISDFREKTLFGQNRAEYRNWGNDITGLQTNRIYCHINGLKTQLILITNFEHVLMVKPLIYDILLSCHKLHYIFQPSKGFSGSFNKPG